MNMDNYKFIKEVNSDIEMLQFMKESEDNIAIPKAIEIKMHWKDDILLWGTNTPYTFNIHRDATYNCYSKITE